jgi:cytochrome P450
MEYDPFSAEVLADPAPASEWLLAQCPVHRYDGVEPPFWSIARHEDVQAALKDTATFSSRYGQGLTRTEETRGMKCDAPVHTLFRNLVRKAFTARAVADMEPRIERIVAELLDDFAERGTADLHDEFASPLPTIVIADMLGVPSVHRLALKRWTDAWVAAMGSTEPERYAGEITEMNEYLLDLIRARQRSVAAGEPAPENLITGLVLAEEDGERLSAEDILNVVRQLLIGGNETTTSLITNALVRLTEQPERYEAVRADPDLIELVIEESLRFDSPVRGLFRTTTREVELRGEVIPADVKVMLLFGAANRDPAAFEDPGTFRLDRDPKELRGHLAFGFGVHVCLGAALARLEARVALSHLIARLPALELTAPPERIAPFMLWGKASMPARWSGGAPSD